ncbi:hypothetical protein [Chamaesiphon minutus]|uniref:Uncharacterized protein n=1 Tax=Chamaesiphon minutus (strain ATCC 27169 / PCC 6605) TaxID=1173020 RepID=K9UH27_CHAP6|nr:hypothetical protein [Chamaesiphon minutus]AFY93746.1 hypothetical protein Cha6605_2706 [Chamaesiphon minutus PCC 6605]
MNKQPNPERSLLHFMLRAQQIAQQEGEADKGYAMVVISILTIILLSLLAAATTFTNLAKSRTDAFVDSNSIFYVAESGLNKRAVEFRQRLETYSGVAEVSAATTAQTLADCFAISPTTPGTDVLGCRNYSFKSSDNISRAVEGGNIALSSGKKIDPVTGALTDEDAVQNNYVAYTLITQNAPQNITIPALEDYEGLNALEYRYVLRSTAKKPVAESVDRSSANIDLSMTFTNRVISLFQFAIFYNGDLEFNSTSPMQVQGRVHSNANIYVQPAGENGITPRSLTTFLATMSASGSIYNRVDAWTPGIGRSGITRFLLTGPAGSTCPDNTVDPLPAGSNCRDISEYSATNTNPLTDAEINTFQRRIQAGITPLNTPTAGFTRKRRYITNGIGESFAKADMRLDFVPNRSTTSTAVIPFNFTSMRTTGSGACSSAAPAAGTDPGANYVAPDREGLSALKCNQLTKGQLQSLRQPVMVLTDINQTPALAAQERTALGAPGTPGAPPLPTAPTLRGANNTDATKAKILRALRVALVSTPTPISLDRLNTRFNAPALDTANSAYDDSLNTFKSQFSSLLNQIFPDPTSPTPTAAELDDQENKRILLSSSPNEIAALRNAWFLPAPIQRVIQSPINAPIPVALPASGFTDGREGREIQMLQTNIASLAVWNRDGLFVNADNTNMTVAYASTETARNEAFADATTANFSTNGLAFERATTPPTNARGLQPLGLGSIDSTEGGLIVHASVNNDLNGDGAIDAANDITADTAIIPGDSSNPIQETIVTPIGGGRTRTTTTNVDYLRRYPGIANRRQSPFAFAFTGGDYLPNNLLLSSDQAVYVQGNFNNNTIPITNVVTGEVEYYNRMSDGSQTLIPKNAPNNLPSNTRFSASIVGDTITVLSNDCVSRTTVIGGVPAGQINCGIPTGNNSVNQPMVINAAFLSNTDVSVGNAITVTPRTTPATGSVPANTGNNRYSGGVNNYIRLLEDWNNGGNPYALNYTGSMVSLGTPLEYSGRYRPGGVAAAPPTIAASYYNIPLRNFGYDPNFNSVERMPPLTPKASYIQQKNFTRIY